MSMELDGKEVESDLIFEDIHPLDGIRIWAAARRLLDALDKQKIRDPYSLNVKDARDEVRALVEFHEGQTRRA